MPPRTVNVPDELTEVFARAEQLVQAYFARKRERPGQGTFTTKGERGTGLGLSTAHGIVHQFGGTITVASSPGGGSRFEIYLPAADDAASRPAASTLPRQSGLSVAPALVLVVEDEPQLRAVVREMLVHAGHEAHAVSAPGEALRYLQGVARPPDLLLTDVVLPEMSGRALADEVLARWPAVRVLYMSGYADDQVLRSGALRPGTSCLHKPFSAEELVEAVAAAVRAEPPAGDEP